MLLFGYDVMFVLGVFCVYHFTSSTTSFLLYMNKYIFMFSHMQLCVYEWFNYKYFLCKGKIFFVSFLFSKKKRWDRAPVVSLF